MFVRLKTSMAGVSYFYDAGEVVDMDEPTALRLIQSEQAELIEGSSETPRRLGRPQKKKEGELSA